jgi:hypothetical protein
MGLRKGSDEALLFQLSQALEGKNAVDVLVGILVVVEIGADRGIWTLSARCTLKGRTQQDDAGIQNDIYGNRGNNL